MHNEQVLNTSCCPPTCDHVGRFFDSVILLEKNKTKQKNTDLMVNLINCYHGFPLGFVSTELQRKKKNLIGLDLSHKDDSAQ